MLRRLFSTKNPWDPFIKSLPEPIYSFDPEWALKTDTKPWQRLTFKELANHKQPPTKTKMLLRDFIDDSLYNPHYGYFSKKAQIFSLEEAIPFNTLKNNDAVLKYVSDEYDSHDHDYINDDVEERIRQVWHTPTELFRPWYGYALAKYILSDFKLRSQPNEPLILYETGAGNGTLMLNILDYIQSHAPDIYKRTQYNIIEISLKLAERQVERQQVRSASKQHSCIHFIRSSIFDWKKTINDSCYFIALEVIDNFAHDGIRYNSKTDQAYQTVVCRDGNGAYFEEFEQTHDPLIQRFLKIRDNLGYQTPLLYNPAFRHILASLPFSPNLTRQECIPTRCLQLFDILFKHFPRHRLLLSDFSFLPDAVPKMIYGPVCQTRYEGQMIPCSTYLVQPGWFDIFFPTNFDVIKGMYENVRAENGVLGKETKVYGHGEFMEMYAELKETRTKSGENPIISFYENMKVFVS